MRKTRRRVVSTSNGRWTPSWCGRAWNGARSPRRTRRCTTRKSRNASAPSGSCWLKAKSGRSSTRRNGSGRSTCPIIRITSTGRAASRKIWKRPDIRTRCRILPCRWRRSELVRVSFFSFRSLSKICHSIQEFIGNLLLYYVMKDFQLFPLISSKHYALIYFMYSQKNVNFSLCYGKARKWQEFIIFPPPPPHFYNH